MSEDPLPQTFSSHVGGDVSGQIGVGVRIHQEQYTTTPSLPVTADERRELQTALDELRARVMAAAPSELAGPAADRLNDLDEAVNAEQPDLNTIQYIRSWLIKHLPAVAGSITALVFHPILGKLVEAGGDALVGEFRRRFGSTPPT